MSTNTQPIDPVTRHRGRELDWGRVARAARRTLRNTPLRVVDDVLQDVLVDLLQVASIDQGVCTQGHAERLARTIARRRQADFHRAQNRRRIHVAGGLVEATAAVPPMRTVWSRDTVSLLATTSGLSPRQNEYLRLCLSGEQTFKAIGRRMGVQARDVRRLHLVVGRKLSAAYANRSLNAQLETRT